MEYVKCLLLRMSILITMLMMSQVSARHHGPHRQQSDETFGGAGLHPGRGHGHGRGHHGLQVQANNGGSPIPGFPMKGPPSAPYIFPQQQPRGPPPPPQMGGDIIVIYPGSSNIYPQQPRNTGQQNPLATNNFPTNNQPTYVNNPFLPPRNTQGQGNIHKQFENIQNLPSIEPVTNELPADSKPSGSTAKPTINPRELDLLYGSNLYEEANAAKQVNVQPDSKIVDEDPKSFDDRILIDSAPRCQEGYKLVGTVCRLKV